MDTMTDRLERLAELQKKSLEPIQTLGGNAFALFERVARKNYELMGDMVEYAVVQSRGSLEQSSPQALYEHQMAEARAFAERMSGRAAEYMALLEEMRDELAEDGQDFREDLADRATAVAEKGMNVAERGAEKGMNEASELSAASARVVASATPGAGTSAKKRATKKSASAGGDSKGSAASGKKRASKKASGKKASGKKASGKKASGKKRASS